MKGHGILVKIQIFNSKVVVYKRLKNNMQLFSFFILPLAYYILFHYLPMYGTLIAFKNFNAVKGIMGSAWVGVKYFKMFLLDPYFYKLLRNTFLINFYSLIFGFPAPIIFAILLNEVRNTGYKRIIQTVSYLPHFLSTVVVCGMLVNFLSTNGIINELLSLFDIEPVGFLLRAEYFRTIYVSSDIWQHLGWSAIIYIAALSNVNLELYEAATIEGANRFQKGVYVTIPGIMPTITIMLILRVGSLLTIGFEKILLLYNGITYETADVISTFVYRRGLLAGDLSYATAVGLFQSVIATVLIITANLISRRYNENSLF